MRIDWSKKSLNEAELFFSTDLKKGLNRKYVIRNRKIYGRNIIDSDFLKSRNFYGPKKKHNLKAIFSRAFDVMMLLLFALLVILTIVYKDFRFVFLMVMIFAGMANAAAMGIRTESKFAGLYNKARPKVAVMRNGKYKNIYIEEIVPGDIILLSVGDIVPCDGRIIQENMLEALENLSGETKISRKTAAVLPYEDGSMLKANILYASTVITSGNVICLAVATGERCLLVLKDKRFAADKQRGEDNEAKEKKKLAVKKQDAPLLQAASQKTASLLMLSKIIFIVAVIIIGLMANKNIIPFAILTMTAAATVTSDWLPLLCDYAIIFVMDKLAKAGVIIKNTKTVDDLNKTDKIVINRNDTFLGNSMILDCVYSSRDGKVYEIDAKNATDIGSVLTYAYLCGEGELKTNKDHNEKYTGSGLDRAVYEAVKKIGLDAAVIGQSYSYIESPKYDSVYGIKSAIVYRGTAFFLIAFGDAENIIDRCNRRASESYFLHNDADSRNKLKAQADELMNRSDTVWAAAVKELKNSDLSDSSSLVYSMDFVGFIGFSPLHSFSSAMAFDQLKNSGADPVIISESGNAAAVRFMKKHNIGSGADGKTSIMSGKELEKYNDIILYSEITKINMFASVNTAGKMRIINALKTRNLYVAATVRELNETPVADSVQVSFADMSARGGMISNRASIMCRSLSATALAEALKGAAIIYGNVKNIFSLLLSFYAAQTLLTLTVLFFGNGGDLVTQSFAAGLIWFSSLILPMFAISIANHTGTEKWTEKRKKIKKETNFLNSALKNAVLLLSGIMLAEILSFTVLAICVKDAGENTIKAMIGLFYLETGRAMTAAAYFITLFSSCAFLTMSMLHSRILFSVSIIKNKVFLLTLFINMSALVLIAAITPVKNALGLIIPPVPAILLCIVFGLIPALINEILKRKR